MHNTLSHTVPKLEEPIRFIDYLPNVFDLITTKKGAKKAIKKGIVRANGEIWETIARLVGGEVLTLHTEEIQQTKPSLDIDIEVIYEDPHLAVVNKPAGLVVSGNKHRTLQNALPTCVTKSTQTDALERPEPIHRLDYPTSGALLVGKTKPMVAVLNKLFADRKIEKTYIAITAGVISEQGTVVAHIDEKPSESSYTILASVASEKYGQLNLTELKPHTGRRHQLRKHMAQIGAAILGDKEYGIEGQILHGKGLYLHSHSLQFLHPVTGNYIFAKAALPKKFLTIFPEIAK